MYAVRQFGGVRLPAAVIALILLCLWVSPADAQALQAIPKLESRVTDLTGTLTAGQQAELEQKLADYEGRKGAQIAVLLVPTTHPEEIEQYSIRVVEAWKVGRKNTDDGALLLLAKNDRTARIEVGYGLEGVLTDATSRRIIDETMVPLLKQDQYFAAIGAGAEQIMRVVDGEALPPPDQRWQRGGGQRIWNLLPFLVIAVLVGSSILRAMFGRVIGATLSGAGTGLVAFLLSQVLGVAIGAAVVAFIIGISGFFGGGWTSGRGGGFGSGFGGLGGGGFGGGGFGGGGFGGGFGGGGGGFGGGGASGSW